MDVTQWNTLGLIGLVVVMVTARYLFERSLSRFLRVARINSLNAQTFAKSLIMVAFNVLVLALFRLRVADLCTFTNTRTGAVVLALGLLAAFFVASLSYQAMKAGFGEGYKALVPRSSLEGVLTWSTLLFLVGPAEDLFFIGFAQNVLLVQLGWGSIAIYALLFTLYHYANVASGVEKRAEFFGMLPVRLLIVSLLAISFYLTRSLIYGLIIHNLVDTASFAALVLGLRARKGEKAL